jgi:hypothetical protein
MLRINIVFYVLIRVLRLSSNITDVNNNNNNSV